MAEAAISKGALRNIYDGQQVELPVLQCVHLKPLQPGQNTTVERFRLVWSDVNHFMQSMLATQLNHMVHDGTLKKGCLVRLKQYQQQTIKEKKILVILDCEVLPDYGYPEKIGQPESLDPTKEEDSKAGAVQQPQQQPAGISSTGFYGNQAPAQSKPQSASTGPSRSNGAGSSSAYPNIYPVEALSPYAHKWTIKVRCTHKGDIKTWHNKNGEGKLFSANFLDETAEIRATGFNDQCDALYELIQEGGVYYISTPCRVQFAKKQFSNVNNDYELTFERDTLVEKAENQDDAPRVRYNFTNVGDLQSVEKDTTIDTIAILKEVGEVQQIVSKTTSKPYDKRELTLVDNTGFSVRLTIWGNTATTFDAAAESVIAFKGVKVSDFGGRSLSLLSSGSMSVDPDIDEAHRLKGWYDAQGRQDSFQTHQNAMGSGLGTGRKDEYKTIAQVREEQLGMSEQADYFTLKATVVYVKQDSIAYPACQSEGCNKKVVETDPGQWRCERCDKAWPNPEYRYILSVNVSDYTGQLWLSCFDDVGRMLLGSTATELMELKENDDKAFTDKIADANCRLWGFRCRAKMDTFQDQHRVRYQVSSAFALNFQAECARLTETLKQYSIQGDSDLFVK